MSSGCGGCGWGKFRGSGLKLDFLEVALLCSAIKCGRTGGSRTHAQSIVAQQWVVTSEFRCDDQMSDWSVVVHFFLFQNAAGDGGERMRRAVYASDLGALSLLFLNVCTLRGQHYLTPSRFYAVAGSDRFS